MLFIEKMPTRYDAGSATVLSGQTSVVPTGASWIGNVWGDDLFALPSQPMVPPQRIDSVNEDGSLTLAVPWPGADASEVPYEIRFVGIIERSTAQTRKVLEELGSFPSWFLSMAGLAGDTDKLAYLNSSSTAVLTDLTAKGREIIGAADAAAARTALELLPVQSSPLDGAENRLLRSGAFGLGRSGAPSISDFNDRSQGTGFSVWGDQAANRPAGLAPYGNILTFGSGDEVPGSGTWLTRILASHTQMLAWQESINGGAWTSARRLYDNSNVVGPVSQSGRVPTGAVIEAGPWTANGYYLRFADGTQICYCYDQQDISGHNWVFPAQFSSMPMVVAAPIGTASRFVSVSVPTTSTTTITIRDNTGNTANSWVFLIAIGRWFE